jgi:dipeptidyl aminopeptidase/acylaminoacyl peptidase
MSLKILSLIFFTVFVFNHGIAQKKMIDSTAVANWPTLGRPKLSDDGKYFSYKQSTFSLHLPQENEQFVVQSIDNSWRTVLFNEQSPTECVFTRDNKRCVFLQKNGMLKILVLGTAESDSIPNVTSYSVCSNIKDSYCLYEKKMSGDSLFIRRLNCNKIGSYPNIADFLYTDDCKHLILLTNTKVNNELTQSIKWIDLERSRSFEVWKGKKASNLVIDQYGKKLAFISKDDSNSSKILVYDRVLDKVIISKFKTQQLSQKWEIDKIVKFTYDQKKLIIIDHEFPEQLQKPEAVMVDVWSYFDSNIQSRQMAIGNNTYKYKAVLDLSSGMIDQLEQDRMQTIGMSKKYLISQRPIEESDPDESYWNPLAQHSTILVPLNGGRKVIVDTCSTLKYFISPESNYLIYFNFKENNFYSYEIANAKVRNLTNLIHTNWHLTESHRPASKNYTRGICAWTKDDQSFIIADENDLWMIDPRGEKAAINLTYGIGKKDSIRFNILNLNITNSILDVLKPIYLSAFDRKTKKNGFYLIKRFGAQPTLLTMSDNIYYIPDYLLGLNPIKAFSKNLFIVQKENAVEFPNYYSTTNFIKFNQITDLHPQNEYNWLTSELHSWQIINGDLLNGILYKPENFDPSKNYPVIFNFYEKKSQLLNKFQFPDFAMGEINVPWLVSHGYLVFLTDINFVTGKSGESALNAIVSAAKHIGELDFVDKKKMGIQGSSFGGFSTNYIVTHTNIFAAAMSSVGISDLITMYGGIGKDYGESNQPVVEMNQLAMGKKLWDDQYDYISNSPVFSTDSVQTPILLENNKEDDGVDFNQGFEFYNALRRLGKRVWLLQYDGQGHGVVGQSAIDYTKRIDQFFDYYLRDKQAPVWMTKGIPFKYKGINSGFKYDSIPPPPALIERKGINNQVGP